ncbi:major allergen Asp f 2 precursor [Drepanopeziza brunnea f. sp. 'multigermtubi' MB_m1]|uniref:Major allergen Asp f 2 n=2 Tax=Drepanopeziza brunnea f. sp. 'multigermtubi' TaxID=698441 RepID=K1XZC3_MARBU|nr:major allergen Asp f 2 precursor [Drepanopeziza brunnea f. sp. 'multigermtubi' MB_m1]EKD18134.1 major allergen Asp f 2 precursor [Drepanopeziza brunnea f. sp. 'multigermtubi' MB_m1]
MLFNSQVLLAYISLVTALPLTSARALESRQQVAWTWNEGATPEISIHVSCNATERAQLQRALNETMTLAQHAKDHIMRFGNSSHIYVKYFGHDSTTAEPAGWYDKIVDGDKTGVVFRCDDVDNKCSNDGWAGHWRGEISPGETVICPLSFESRWPLETLCGHGYTVAEGNDEHYFGADLMHRLYHTPKISEGVVEEYVETQAELLQLAIDSPELAVRNSVTLRHFAVEAYAYDIAVPGQGCPGTLPESPETIPTDTSSSADPSPTDASAAYTPDTQTSTAADEATPASEKCLTLADGVELCV